MRIRHPQKERLRDKPLNKRYHSVKKRCCNPNEKAYETYGKRGILFLWNSYQEFANDMEKGFDEHVKIHGLHNTTLDRINNDGHYSKENCRWATFSVQNKNRPNFHPKLSYPRRKGRINSVSKDVIL